MTGSEHINKQMLKTTLSIQSRDINKNLDNIIKEKLTDLIEGLCYNDGYVVENTINIIKRNIGKIETRNNKSLVSYQITYTADIITPSEGDIFDVYINNINKMGVISYFKVKEGDTHETSPLIVMIPKDYMESSIMNIDDLHIGQHLKVVIIGSRIKFRSDKIQVIAKPIS
jgi:DNA-directed RNA polymerase subunit E'/Rpb7